MEPGFIVDTNVGKLANPRTTGIAIDTEKEVVEQAQANLSE